METIGQRLAYFAKSQGYTVQKFERLCGFSNGTVTRLRLGPAPAKMQAIRSHFPELNEEWLLTGEGSMTVEQPDSNTADSSDYETTPLLTGVAAAGFAEALDPCALTCDRIAFPGASRCTAAIRVDGDSMRPTILSGDTVGFRVLPSPDSIVYGKVYIVDYTDADGYSVVTVKRLRRSDHPDRIRLQADNPDYDTNEIPRSWVRHVAEITTLIRHI